MLIENATTGSQSITISQGSGSTVTIASGAVKMVYLDGAGAGGAVVEALADLELPTITVADLTATTADINGGTIDGTVIGGSTAAAITGTTIAGTSFVSSGDMTFGDSDKAVFGAGSDLQIYHDGTNSVVGEVGTGNLYVQSNGAQILLQPIAGEQGIVVNSNADVGIYYDNSLKLATTATGIDVTGTVTADGLTVDGGNTIRLNASSGDDFLTIEQGTSDAKISANSTAGNANLQFFTTSVGSVKQRVDIATNGDISFYEDTGTTPKFFWDASAESLGIGTTSPAYALDVSGDSDTSIRIRATGGGAGDDTLLRMLVAGTDASNYIQFGDADDGDAGYIRYQHSTDNLIVAVNASEAMGINSSGTLSLSHNLREAIYNLTGTDINPVNGSIQYKTLSANTTFTESLADGDSVMLRISGGATYTVTWPTMTWVTAGGNTAPTLGGSDVVVLWQESSTVYGAYVGSYA